MTARSGGTENHPRPAGIARGEGPVRMVVAGGGTGGHLFPGIAVAEAFVRLAPQNAVRFVSTGNPLERSALQRAGFPLERVLAGPLKGRSPRQRLAALAKLAGGLVQAVGVLRRFRPHVVLGVGGYASAPVVAAARTLGLPVALHEQNRLPGVTNRLLSRLADRVYLTFGESARHFPAGRCRVTGNPVRRSFLAGAPAPGRRSDRFTVLVVGGSQGAHRVNMAVLEAAGALQEPERYRFVHQTGRADFERVRAGYGSCRVEARVSPFIEEMAAAYGEADLVVCRAGATTVAELTVVGRPAVFVPFPFAADDHQARNAQALVEAGAAEMILEKDLDGPGLARRLDALRRRPDRLEEMGRHARRLGRPEAAETIAEDCSRLAAGQRR